MKRDTWDKIIAEMSARPLPLSEERFRQWMSRQPIFVSSLMDDEMTPFRDAIRNYLRSKGATPVMWEEITPQDKGAQRAYLDGVDQSTIFLLMLGRRYGVADASGASPTHKEGIRAAERKISRLLFVLGNVPSSERDVKLNDWLNSLYNEIAGATFISPDELVVKLDSRLRDMAAQNERVWIKLGDLVFPGKVRTDLGAPGDGGLFTVTARVTEGRVRHALLALTQPFGPARNRADRLTWSDKSFPVEVISVTAESEYSHEDAVEIKCRMPRNWHGESGSSIAMMSINSEGPGALARVWTQRAIFGENYPQSARRGMDLGESFSEPDAKTLPEVLSETNASGWFAEGLVKLYVVEEVARRYGGHFQHIEVGTPTVNGVRLEGSFTFGPNMYSGREQVSIQGIVPLRT